MEERDRILRERLQQHGRPVTPQRLRVWQALHAERDHPSAAELHARCPELPLATVYNALELFTALGLVHPLALEGVVRYDVDTAEHVNVICTACGRVVDVALALPATMGAAVAAASGFHLSHPRVDWYGRCAPCRTEQGVAHG